MSRECVGGEGPARQGAGEAFITNAVRNGGGVDSVNNEENLTLDLRYVSVSLSTEALTPSGEGRGLR